MNCVPISKHSPKPFQAKCAFNFKKSLEQNSLSRTITPHIFGHSFATIADVNVDIRYIQQILGHSFYISHTNLYSRIIQKQKNIGFFNPVSTIHSDKKMNIIKHTYFIYL